MFRTWQRIANRYELAMKTVAALMAGAAVALMLWCVAALVSGLAWLALWLMTLAISGG